LVRADNLIEHLRAVKDKNEIRKIKKALGIHKQAHQFIKRNIKPNISEHELFLRLDRFVKSKGASFAFDPIIASGPNSCYPHARVTKRKLRRDEPLLIDMGIDVEGYKSDLTRMFFLGKIAALLRQVFDAVDEARHRAIAGIKAGVPTAEIDALARNHLKNQKLAKYFGHALGHGVGLEVHEGPRLAHNDSSVLKEGMVITVEPAVYIPGKFGIRLEDMVLVKKRNCEILSDDIH
jgi:Xaa-Pro aminopeptidase